MARLRPTISGNPVTESGAEADGALSGRATLPPGGALEERVSMLLDLIRPAVQADGGDVELVGIGPDKKVKIRLHGACVGCPSSAVTLQVGIERNLREHIPEIAGVEAVD